MRIPPNINREVIEDWLNGLSREEIAQKNGLSSGTISNIIKHDSKEFGEIDLEYIRPLAKILKKEGIEFDELIEVTRIRNRIQDIGLSTQLAEKYIELMDEHCFRKQIEPEKFIESIDFLANLPDEERNVELQVEQIKLVDKQLKSKNEKLNKLNNNVKKVAKSLREIKKEEKTILSNLEAYKEIKNQLDWAKSLDIHPYMALFLLIKSDYDEFFGRKTSSANVK